MNNESLSQLAATIQVAPTMGPIQYQQPYQYTVMAEVVKEPGIFGKIMSWLSLDPLNYAILIFIGIALAQLITNYKNEQSRMGKLFTLGLSVLSLWGLWLHYNPIIGGIFTGIAVLLTIQSIKYSDEEESDDVEQQVEQRPVPKQISIKQPPVTADIFGYIPPKTNLGLNIF